jgi:uncharacterized protein YdhG (YjbR/CyaY superfamily)
MASRVSKRGSTAKEKAMGRDAAAVEAYLASLPEDVQTGLRKLQAAIATTIPGATRGISYGIPAFKLHGRPLVWFAAFKQHCSFFPGAAAIRIYAVELKGFKTSKGTIRFLPNKPPPGRLVAKLVKARISELRKSRR